MGGSGGGWESGRFVVRGIGGARGPPAPGRGNLPLVSLLFGLGKTFNTIFFLWLTVSVEKYKLLLIILVSVNMPWHSNICLRI